MTTIKKMLGRKEVDRAGIIALLSATAPDEIESIRKAAEQTTLKHCGDVVYWRGLVEFSNVCTMDCRYCGIRRSNESVKRYTLTADRIVEAAKWCAAQGYGSVVLQSGERKDREFIAFVEHTVRRIKAETISGSLPAGVGVTLCVGEQSPETYSRFFLAGAHRYLLRIETTNRRLFSQIHPAAQRIGSRLACLGSLKEIGYQVGTGVMIGLPGQTIEMLADDILFFRNCDVDMIGMGPYLPHPETPLGRDFRADGDDAKRKYQLSLLMIAAVRLCLKDVNIAATTALQAMHPTGREDGLRYGANVLMPQLTPSEHKKDYLLYPDKPCIEEDRAECAACLAGRVKSAGRRIGLNAWGDPRHFAARKRRS